MSAYPEVTHVDNGKSEWVLALISVASRTKTSDCSTSDNPTMMETAEYAVDKLRVGPLQRRGKLARS